MNKLSTLFLFLTLPLLVASCQQKYSDLPDGVYAEFETTEGTFVAKLYNDATPLTVSNFVALAEGTNGKIDAEYKGKKFYEGLKFHRVIKDFMIQGGDPKGDGTGNPGYAFPDEIVDTLKFDRKGLLAMANSGPATNGSQFFITLAETPWLNGRHTIFGEIVVGQDIVDKIGNTPTNEKDAPEKDVIMKKVNIIRKGKVKVPYFTDEMERIESVRKEKEKKIKEIADDKASALKALKEKADSLESGVKIYFQNRGEGAQPNEGEKVLLNYAGYLMNGRLFDTNKLDVAEKFETVDDMRKAGGGYAPMPTDYSMSAGLIPGFKEGMLKMRKGDKATIFIPAHLAYGSRGVPGVIPPDSELVFELEMLDQ